VITTATITSDQNFFHFFSQD
jgi:hypothetical protein